MVNKNIFDDLLKRYHLGGVFDDTIIKVIDGTMHIPFINPESNFCGFIQYKGFDLPDQDIPLSDVSQLIKFLDIFGDEIEMNVEYDDDLFKILSVKDKKYKVNFNLPDESVLPDYSDIKKFAKLREEYGYLAKFSIDDEFVKTFTKIKSSVKKENNELNIGLDNGKLLFTVGSYHKIKFTHEIKTLNQEFEMFKINMEYISQVLNKNKDFKSSCVYIGELVVELNFTSKDDVKSVYYLLREEL